MKVRAWLVWCALLTQGLVCAASVSVPGAADSRFDASLVIPVGPERWHIAADGSQVFRVMPLDPEAPALVMQDHGVGPTRWSRIDDVELQRFRQHVAPWLDQHFPELALVRVQVYAADDSLPPLRFAAESQIESPLIRVPFVRDQSGVWQFGQQVWYWADTFERNTLEQAQALAQQLAERGEALARQGEIERNWLKFERELSFQRQVLIGQETSRRQEMIAGGRIYKSPIFWLQFEQRALIRSLIDGTGRFIPGPHLTALTRAFFESDRTRCSVTAQQDQDVVVRLSALSQQSTLLKEVDQLPKARLDMDRWFEVQPCSAPLTTALRQNVTNWVLGKPLLSTPISPSEAARWSDGLDDLAAGFAFDTVFESCLSYYVFADTRRPWCRCIDDTLRRDWLTEAAPSHQPRYQVFARDFGSLLKIGNIEPLGGEANPDWPLYQALDACETPRF
jgi:hypothetical protein